MKARTKGARITGLVLHILIGAANLPGCWPRAPPLRRLNMTHRLAVLPEGGIATARKRFLSPPLRVCVVGLLFVPLAAGGCQPADEPVLPRRDLADLDRLLRLMQQRLTLMHEVARWKWNAGQPVTDAQRERELLHGVVERGRGKGLDPELVRPFFAAQMERTSSGSSPLP